MTILLYALMVDVDMVITWVNGSDPVWRAKYSKTAKEHGFVMSPGFFDARFSDNGELKYSLRSIDKYLPWIHKIFILTDNQVPYWLNTSHPKIQMVYQKDIASKRFKYPSFSSSAIEFLIPRIPGLSEYFLYGNDDFMYYEKNTVRDFFTENMKPIFHIGSRQKFHPSEPIIPAKPSPSEYDFEDTVRHTLSVVYSHHPADFSFFWQHLTTPIVKSQLKRIIREYKPYVDFTMGSQFRAPHTIVIQYLIVAHLIAKHQCRIERDAIKSKYFLYDYECDSVFNFTDTPYKNFVVNHCLDMNAQHQWLEATYPHKSSFEM